MSARETVSPAATGEQPGPVDQQPQPVAPALTSRNATDDPQPWHSDEDVRGWRRVGRAHPSSQPIGASVLVDLDAEQAAWLGHEATRAGLTLAGFVKQLIDNARDGAGYSARALRRRGIGSDASSPPAVIGLTPSAAP